MTLLTILGATSVSVHGSFASSPSSLMDFGCESKITTSLRRNEANT
jgi:hypothetical protein